MSASSFCPECGGSVSENARFCETCGHSLNEEDTQSSDAIGNVPSTPVAQTTKRDSFPDIARSRSATTSKLGQRIEPCFAAGVTAVFPGLGHFYIEEVKKGIIWMAVWLVLMIVQWKGPRDAPFLVILTMITYVAAAFEAFRTAKKKNRAAGFN